MMDRVESIKTHEFCSKVGALYAHREPYAPLPRTTTADKSLSSAVLNLLWVTLCFWKTKKQFANILLFKKNIYIIFFSK